MPEEVACQTDDLTHLLLFSKIHIKQGSEKPLLNSDNIKKRKFQPTLYNKTGMQFLSKEFLFQRVFVYFMNLHIYLHLTHL